MGFSMKSAIAPAATLALVAMPSLGFAQATCGVGAFRGTWYAGLNAGDTDVSCRVAFSVSRGRLTGTCYTVEITVYPPTRVVMNVQRTLTFKASCGFAGPVSVACGPVFARLEGYAPAPTRGRPVIARGMAYVTGAGLPLYSPMTPHQRPNSPVIPW